MTPSGLVTPGEPGGPGEPGAGPSAVTRPVQVRRSGTGKTLVAVVQCLDDTGDALLTLGTD